MADTANPQQPTSASYNQPNWKVETVHQTVVVQGRATPEEVTPERLAAIETRYRAQVIGRYNRLGFAGLGVGDLRLSDVALDDVFVRLTLTVEKIVRELMAAEEWEREGRSRNPLRWGRKKDESAKESERPRERIVTVQEAISLGDALAQHALIVGEPGAGKSTLLRWLAVTFAASNQREADRLGPQADADRLPLLVELGRLPEQYLKAESRETPNWKVFLPAHLTAQPPFDDIPASFLAQALVAGRCLLLCDGLDEIADLSARRRMADSLAEYARSSANRLVLSSRPAGVSGSEGALGSRFQRLTIQRFTAEDVRRFFGFLYAQNPELSPDEAGKEADALYAVVKSQPKTLELATTPLLATLLLAIWNENGYLPERRVELYELCCRMLIESWEGHHDVAYTGVLREIGWERHLRLLAPLAYAIHSSGQRTDAPASELIPVLAQAMQDEGLASPASATLEAEKFLRTLSLRSGLLQFLGADRYGFPHLTFQEYLTARYIAAQPDPDYIDLVMVHLHKAWWREVHLLVIGHLGSGSEGADKASNLLHIILGCYDAPWYFLCSMRSKFRYPEWLLDFEIDHGGRKILKWLIQMLRIGFVVVPSLPVLTRNSIAARVVWQFEKRLAWVLAREYTIVVTEFFDCTHLSSDIDLCDSIAMTAELLVRQLMLDAGQLENENAVLLDSAIRSLRQLGKKSLEVVTELVKALGDTDPHVSQMAAFSLSKIGQESTEVITALTNALDDSHRRIRKGAALTLCEIGQTSQSVIDKLVNMVDDPELEIRTSAAWSLGRLACTSSDAMSALMSGLNSMDWWAKGMMVDSLGVYGKASPGVQSMLLDMLSDSSWQIREAAARGLGALGNASPDVVSALMGVLGDTTGLFSTVNLAAAKSLGQLEQSSPDATSLLLGVLDESNDYLGFERLVVVRCLGALRQISPDGVTTLISLLDDSDWRTRQEAANSLGLLGYISEDVVSVLTRLLSDSCSRVRETAARSLLHLGQELPGAVVVLIDAMNDSDSDIRKSSVTIMGRLNQVFIDVIAVLASALRDSDWFVQQAAAASLVRLGERSSLAVAVLVDALHDSDSYMRQAAASSLVQLGQVSEDVKTVLVEGLRNSDSGIHQAAAESLGKLKIYDETELYLILIALNRRLHDRDDDVRRAALTAIRRLLDGRQIPGYRWVPIRERRERAKKRRILGYGVIGLAVLLLVAWVAAGVATYLRVDPFIERFVAYALGLVALAAGVVQVLGWLRRPPWDR